MFLFERQTNFPRTYLPRHPVECDVMRKDLSEDRPSESESKTDVLLQVTMSWSFQAHDSPEKDSQTRIQRSGLKRKRNTLEANDDPDCYRYSLPSDEDARK